MAKTRNAQIKKSSEEIVKFLKKGLTANEIANKGYSLATCKYYKRKLFEPVAYERFLKTKRKSA